MVRPKGSKSKEVHFWTGEERACLEEIVNRRNYNSIKDITDQMNNRCEYQFTPEQIKRAIYRNKLKTGLTGCFNKGSVPWNKGKKGIQVNHKTWFKKGNIPKNYRPLGSESITVDGYTKIKVSEPNGWRLKQQVIWEEVNGPIPDKHAVIFADGNKENFSIENLLLVSRKQLLFLNRNNLIFDNSELTKTGVNIANLMIKIGERKNEWEK